MREISKHTQAHFGTVRKISEPSGIYELEKHRWVEDHPEATSQEYERAIREIANRLGY